MYDDVVANVKIINGKLILYQFYWVCIKGLLLSYSYLF